MSLSILLRRLLLGVLLVSSTACSSHDVSDTDQATPIDLPRFMGAWHVIAHVPYFGERGHVASRDEYTLRTDGKIGVRYVYQEGFAEPVKTLDSKATVKSDTGIATFGFTPSFRNNASWISVAVMMNPSVSAATM